MASWLVSRLRARCIKRDPQGLCITFAVKVKGLIKSIRSGREREIEAALYYVTLSLWNEGERKLGSCLIKQSEANRIGGADKPIKPFVGVFCQCVWVGGNSLCQKVSTLLFVSRPKKNKRADETN